MPSQNIPQPEQADDLSCRSLGNPLSTMEEDLEIAQPMRGKAGLQKLNIQKFPNLDTKIGSIQVLADLYIAKIIGNRFRQRRAFVLPCLYEIRIIPPSIDSKVRAGTSIRSSYMKLLIKAKEITLLRTILEEGRHRRISKRNLTTIIVCFVRDKEG